MKKLITLQIILCVLFNTLKVNSQNPIIQDKLYMIVKNDGAEFIGKILSQDAREILIDTKDRGQILIPKHEVKEIKQIEETSQGITGEYFAPEIFSTRYFLTTNALPLKKETYVAWNLFGPEVQFGLGEHIGAGLMTTYIGAPVIAALKYSIKLDKQINLGLGTLLGTGTWVFNKFRLALPFAALTFGNKNLNINFCGGYGYVSNEGKGEGRALGSVGASIKVAKRVSLVFDSFLMAAGPLTEKNVTHQVYDNKTGMVSFYTTVEETRKPGLAVIVPGVRIQTSADKAFQFGFAGINFSQKWLGVPIPVLQWFRRL